MTYSYLSQLPVSVQTSADDPSDVSIRLSSSSWNANISQWLVSEIIWRLSSPLTPRVGSASKTNDDRRKRSASLGSSLTSAVGREQVSDDRLEDLVWNTHCFAAGPGKKEGRGPGGPRTPCYLQPAMINCGRSSSAAVFVLQAGGCLHCWHPSCGGVDPGGSC